MSEYNSPGNAPKISLNQLCAPEDEISKNLQEKLIEMENKNPRRVVVLANMVIEAHCSRQVPPEFYIRRDTWLKVQDDWITKRVEYEDDQNFSSQEFEVIRGIFIFKQIN